MAVTPHCRRRLIVLPLGNVGKEYPVVFKAVKVGEPQTAPPVPVQEITVQLDKPADGISRIKAPLASDGTLLVKVTV